MVWSVGYCLKKTPHPNSDAGIPGTLVHTATRMICLLNARWNISRLTEPLSFIKNSKHVCSIYDSPHAFLDTLQVIVYVVLSTLEGAWDQSHRPRGHLHTTLPFISSLPKTVTLSIISHCRWPRFIWKLANKATVLGCERGWESDSWFGVPRAQRSHMVSHASLVSDEKTKQGIPISDITNPFPSVMRCPAHFKSIS